MPSLLTRTLRTVTAAAAAAGLLVAAPSAPASASVTTTATDISVVALRAPVAGYLPLVVRYRCTPGKLTQLVGIYDDQAFDWIGPDELYGQEESRLFDVPCTGRYERATIKLVTNGRVPATVYVRAGIGVSDPHDWSFEVANDDGRFRRR